MSLGPLAGHRVRYEDRVPGGRGLRALFLDPKQQAAAEDSWGSGRRGSPRHPLIPTESRDLARLGVTFEAVLACDTGVQETLELFQGKGPS